jgi:drug/metabolite transporter (DMT)-like permease
MLDHRMKAVLLTCFALIAFAFNSILCRMALAGGEIDAVSFTAIRLVSGAAALALLIALTGKTQTHGVRGHWPSAFFLFIYAIFFSFAYLGLTAGTGALILFGFVQISMIGFSIFKGERPSALEWLGFVVALAGLIYLVSPGLSAPPLWNAGLMAAAGIAWGAYTLRGKGSDDPLADTAGNFLRSVPMVLVAALPFLYGISLSGRGVLLAMLSGAVASGIGYSVWYAALSYLTPTRAAVLQLAVPVLTAVIGVALLAEAADLRLVSAAVLILGGIRLTIWDRKK